MFPYDPSLHPHSPRRRVLSVSRVLLGVCRRRTPTRRGRVDPGLPSRSKFLSTPFLRPGGRPRYQKFPFWYLPTGYYLSHLCRPSGSRIARVGPLPPLLPLEGGGTPVQPDDVEDRVVDPFATPTGWCGPRSEKGHIPWTHVSPTPDLRVIPVGDVTPPRVR